MSFDGLDEILLREAAALQQKIGFHTVPLFFFNGNAAVGNVPTVGSGVLLKLCDHYFIVTAGHCVQDAGSPGRDEIVVGIRTSQHRFSPRLDRRGYIKTNERDIGFFEVPPSDAQIIEANGKVFLSHTSLVLKTSGELHQINDWMVLAGYPRSIIEGRVETQPGVRLLAYSTTIENTGDAPATRMRPPPGEDVVDLWVPSDGNIATFPVAGGTANVPLLRGASGGGCWLANIRTQSTHWKPQSIQLVGIHTGSCDTVEIDGAQHVFAREALIAQHIRLIVSEYDDVHSFALREWPDIFGHLIPAGRL